MIELKNKLIEYISGELSISEFEDWFIPSYWNVHRRNDEELSNLVYDIELELAEYSIGDWTEKELKEHLNLFIGVG